MMLLTFLVYSCFCFCSFFGRVVFAQKSSASGSVGNISTTTTPDAFKAQIGTAVYYCYASGKEELPSWLHPTPSLDLPSILDGTGSPALPSPIRGNRTSTSSTNTGRGLHLPHVRAQMPLTQQQQPRGPIHTLVNRPLILLQRLG